MMLRAGRLIGTSTLGRAVSDIDYIRAAWDQTVGKKIARRCRVHAIFDSVLVVEVEDQIWQSQLTTLSSQIIRKLEKTTGRELVTAIQFRVGIPRRQPARQEVSPAFADEADHITDPGMRRLFRAARRRAISR